MAFRFMEMSAEVSCGEWDKSSLQIAEVIGEVGFSEADGGAHGFVSARVDAVEASVLDLGYDMRPWPRSLAMRRDVR
jgi:hypothetical protein